MDLISTLDRLIQPIKMRLRNMIVRGVVKSVDDSTKWQRAQIEALEGEVLSGVPVFQPYGFACNPPVAANGEAPEALMVRLGGRPDGSVIIGIGDRRYRLKNLSAEEVAMYDAQGSSIVCKASGDIVLTAASGKFRIENDVTIDGALVVTGDVHSQGTVKGDTDVVVGSSPASVSLKGHGHNAAGGVPPLVDGNSLTVTGTTGAPVPT